MGSRPAVINWKTQMKFTLKGFAGNLLFALNIFIVFLLLFENKYQVPVWLQPVGRMHPMLLHFPIVILILAMALEFISVRPADVRSGEFFRLFTRNLLLAGALSSAITVIMGLFLSREGGYEGSEALLWHKWSGVAIVFFASLIYSLRERRWYRSALAKGTAGAVIVCIVLAGHFGATLSHGENFILEPVMAQKKQVPFEEAMVFDHVVKPIINEKCISCHNPSKIKGNLLLTDIESMEKGGKTGSLFLPGSPDSSLMIARILLPLADKKHMPPANKPQLSDDELEIFRLWVKHYETVTAAKVIDLPETDTLRMLASARLRPGAEGGEQYDFAAADLETVKKLNNDYRVITPLAVESPALDVNIFNKNTYAPKVLEELVVIKDQIVSLSANGMPVKDDDLKIIAGFSNLRTLQLNFTEVTAAGIKQLAGLNRLSSLSLSGTKMKYEDLRHSLGSMESLKTVSIWQSGLTEAEQDKLQEAYSSIEFIRGFRDDGGIVMKLTPPRLKNTQRVFNDSMTLDITHPIRGVSIRYTTDGSAPDSVHSPVLTEKVLKENHTLVKAMACREGWHCSDVVSYDFYRSLKPDRVELLQAIDGGHKANGERTFFDGRLAEDRDFFNPDYAGWTETDMDLMLVFDSPRKIKSVSLNTLVSVGYGVFPPAVLEVRSVAADGSEKLLLRQTPEMPKKEGRSEIKLFGGSFQAAAVTRLRIVAKPLEKLPSWHFRKGMKGTILCDEIILN